MDINLSNYKELKEKKVMWVTQVAPGCFCLATRSFDQFTGELSKPNILPVEKAQVQQVLADLQARMDSVQELLSDLEALEKGV